MDSTVKEFSWIVGTGNPGKLAELQEVFVGTPVTLRALPDPSVLDSVAETGATIEENARIKAREIARQCGGYVLADDTGLFVDALDGAPGVRTARYAGDGATATANRGKLLEALEGVPGEQRTARFICALALADPSGQIVLQAEGACEGMILEQPRGESAFPYDPLFWLPEYQTTLCLLDPEIRRRINHRARAAGKLINRMV